MNRLTSPFKKRSKFATVASEKSTPLEKNLPFNLSSHNFSFYEEGQLRIRLLCRLCLISILADTNAIISFSILSLITGQFLLAVFALVNLGAVVVTLISYYFAKANYYHRGCWLLIGSSSLGIGYGYWLLGTEVAVVVPVIAVIALAIVLMKTWEVVVISGLWMLITASLYLSQDIFKVYTPPIPLSPEAETFINLVLVLAVMPVIVTLLLIPAKALLKATQAQNLLLHSALDERRRIEEELRRSEENLRQSQKMEAIGRLAGGIAHDFNNLLTAILGNSDFVLTMMQEDDPNREEINEISKAAHRAAELTQRLLAFSRKQVLKPKVVNLNNIILDLNKMLQRLIGENIELISLTDPALGFVQVDPGQIEQVIVNMVVNSRDAMPNGGKLIIETTNIELDQQYAQQHISVKPGFYVLLKISDTGVGIDAETLPNIFEPFFTTKELGRGTGLGLATVYGIIKQSEGNIWAYSEVGIGTTFKIYLPRLLTMPSNPETVERPLSASSYAQATILLVEDEQTIKNLVRRILEKNGYLVLEASEGQEALLLCQNYLGDVDLVLSDVVMPGINGPELVAQIRALRPQIKVLYMSGYSDQTVINNGLFNSGSGVAFLEKPFSPQSLLQKVRELLI